MANSEKVAFIHDDPATAVSLLRIARSAGLHADLYGSVASFLADEDHANFNCAVLDESLAEEDTFVRLRQRTGEHHDPLPVIILGKLESSKSRQRAKELGAAAFFREPLDGEALLDAISWLL